MKRKNKFCRALATGMVAFAVVGCGGAGSRQTIGESVALSGGIETLINTDAPAIPAATTTEASETTYETQIDGVTTTVHVPPTPDGAPAGTPLALFPADVPIFNGSFGRAPGDLVVICHGKDQTSSITTSVPYKVTAAIDGLRLSSPIALAPGFYECRLEGPIVISRRLPKADLTIGRIGFKFQVTDEGKCSFPFNLTGAVPANGETTQYLNCYAFLNSAFSGRTATLSVTNGNGANYTQKVKLGDILAAFSFSSQNGFTVSKTGLANVEFSCY